MQSPRAHDLAINAFGARFMGRLFACAIGRAGIGQKTAEGDGITPIGRFRLLFGGYRPDRLVEPNTALLMHAISHRYICSDDPKDPNYNKILWCFRHPYRHEKLRRSDPLYNVLAVLDYNLPNPQPGRGSAIFLHVWRAPRMPTEGCIAFAQSDLLWILARWQHNSRVVIGR